MRKAFTKLAISPRSQLDGVLPGGPDTAQYHQRPPPSRRPGRLDGQAITGHWHCALADTTADLPA
jgi:hypothetical protein